MTAIERCDHPEFSASVAVARLCAIEGGPVTSYAADVRVRCSRCGMPFRFVGVRVIEAPPAAPLEEPVVTVDGCELLVSIEEGLPWLRPRPPRIGPSPAGKLH
jgi:hypothetical protein